MFPVMLDIRGRRCLVVGGGGVALRKVEGLLAEGGEVTVVAPEVVDPIVRLAGAGALRLERRPYRDGEAEGYALVFAATDDREVNRRVFEDAERAGVWVNVADDPELCTFHLPATIRRGRLRIALASGGEAPFVVRRLRQALERRLGQEWGEWLEAAARFRERVRAEVADRRLRERLYDRFFRSSVDTRQLSVRVPTEREVAAWLEEGGAEPPAHRGSVGGGRPERRAGLVSLVGAGPGEPGLLTLRGHRRLMAADAVVYDRLAAPALPPELPARVELHCVGKTAGHHPVPQEEITALLVRLAREGKRVVRLKGGDPYVFGRGGEEAEALRAAGVPVEVIPGVTAGLAAPAWAGIPVTHRREAVRVTLVTAHECIKSAGPQVRWDLLARDPHATLVGYMGVTSLPTVVERLLAAGMDPATPAAVVQRGTTSGQRTVRASLAELPRAAREARIRPPAVFVIGPTVRHAERLDWVGRLPLVGRRVAVAPEAWGLAEALELAGAEVVRVPVPLTPAARVALGALPLTDCVVGSSAEVEALDGELGGPGWEGRVGAWCLGRAAAERARALGWETVVELGRDDGDEAAVVAAMAGELAAVG